MRGYTPATGLCEAGKTHPRTLGPRLRCRSPKVPVEGARGREHPAHHEDMEPLPTTAMGSPETGFAGLAPGQNDDC